ncbi:Uncharacterised protein [uncultured archaeon]|nr:Uncharacterised protein [uncultured archaeon]
MSGMVPKIPKTKKSAEITGNTVPERTFLRATKLPLDIEKNTPIQKSDELGSAGRGRRNFLRTAVAAGIGAVVAPKILLAMAGDEKSSIAANMPAPEPSPALASGSCETAVGTPNGKGAIQVRLSGLTVSIGIRDPLQGHDGTIIFIQPPDGELKYIDVSKTLSSLGVSGFSENTRLLAVSSPDKKTISLYIPVIGAKGGLVLVLPSDIGSSNPQNAVFKFNLNETVRADDPAIVTSTGFFAIVAGREQIYIESSVSDFSLDTTISEISNRLENGKSPGQITLSEQGPDIQIRAEGFSKIHVISTITGLVATK